MKYARFADHLNAQLHHLERSPAWLARRLNLNPATVTRWCGGETRPSKPETVVRIADVLGFSDSESRQRLLAAAGYGYSPTESHPPSTRPSPTPSPETLSLPARPVPYLRGLQPLELPPSLADQFESLRQYLRERGAGTLHAIALWRIEALEWNFKQQQPDVAWMEANLGWFQRNLPDLVTSLVAILWHPAVLEMLWHAGQATYQMFYYRLGTWQPSA